MFRHQSLRHLNRVIKAVYPNHELMLYPIRPQDLRIRNKEQDQKALAREGCYLQILRPNALLTESPCIISCEVGGGDGGEYRNSGTSVGRERE